MECLFGLVGEGFTLLVSDKLSARSIVVMKSDEDRTRDLGPTLGACFSGEPGDAVRFTEYIQRNICLYKMRHDIELGTSAAVSFIRNELAEFLRSRTPYATNLLVGGWDARDGAQLYWIDYLASSTKVPFAAHGYGAYFLLSVFDRYYRKHMDLKEAKELIRKCIHELQTRFIVNLPKFIIKQIDSDGIREIHLDEKDGGNDDSR
jgi:20S proteasome subunit beta 4